MKVDKLTLTSTPNCQYFYHDTDSNKRINIKELETAPTPSFFMVLREDDKVVQLHFIRIFKEIKANENKEPREIITGRTCQTDNGITLA